MTRTHRRVLATASAIAAVAIAVFVLCPAVPEHVPAPLPTSATPASTASTTASDSGGDNTTLATPGPPAIQQPAPSAAHIAALRDRVARSGLRDAEADGAVTFAAGGQVQPDRALRRLFDWYLALSGELAPADIRTLLAADLADRHGDAIAAEVLALFERYLDLQRAAATLDPRLDDHARLARLHALRRHWFGDAAEAMFGEEEADLARTLDRMALLSDPGLSDTERAALAAELDATQPATVRAAREAATVATLADEQSRQFDALGTDPATRHEERADLFGETAANRLAALDAERATWDGRVSDYLRERDALRNSALDPATRDAQLAQLRERSFAEHELRRIDALDAIDALPPGG